ncbi:MAG: MFS transporter [Corynebacterium sp.]|nr:MFS transporter [Corynebacterium sp.]
MTTIPAFLVSFANSYAMVLALAFLVGFAGNLFSVGTAWNSAWFGKDRQGLALGVFGAGNVGASVTKFIGPPLIAATAGSTYVLGISGGWRLIPVIYAVLLVLIGVLTWVIVPKVDRAPGASKSITEMLRPLRHIRIWRFSLYYVVVFGAYVALSA